MQNKNHKGNKPRHFGNPKNKHVKNAANTPAPKKTNRVLSPLKRLHIYLYQLDQRDLKYAIEAAENPDNPNRQYLLAIYKETFRDLHIKSQITTAIEKVNAEEWAVVDWDKLAIDKDWTMFLDNQWFEKIGEYVNLSEFWGSQLLEAQLMVPTPEKFSKLAPFTFSGIKIVPRDHWEPVSGEVLIYPTDSRGIPVRQLGLTENFLMETGDPEDLGLLQDLARDYIFKKFAKGDWSQSSEKWTDPILLIQTASDNDVENDKKMDWAQNLSKNRAGLFDDQDKITMLESKSTSGNAHKVYHDFLMFLNEELSKGINGQTGTSDQKSFVGSAEVHERLLDDYTTARLRKRFYYHNNVTFPFLTHWGFKLENKAWVPVKFFKKFMAQYSLEPEELTPAKPEKGNQNGEGGAKGTPVKKSIRHRVDNLVDLHALISESYTCSCGTNHFDVSNEDYTAGIDVDEYIDRAIERLYERQLNAGDVDAELIYLTATSLWDAVRGATKKNLDFGSVEHQLMLQMRHNVFVTAVFKNYSNQLEVIRELFDENGNLRTFTQFKNAVKPIMEKFNKNYLRTEWNFARLSARAALRWKDYEKKGGKITYWTVGDGRVRDKHRLLHKTTKPVGDKFWDLYYPPIQGDWGCRCYTRWASEDTPDVDPQGYPELKPGGGGNVGKSGTIFNTSSPYFQIASLVAGSLRYFGQKVPIGKEKITYNMARYDQLKKETGLKLIHTDNLNGGFVFRQDGVTDAEMKDLLPVSSVLASKGDAIVIRRAMNVSGIKNPDLDINGIVVEVKTNTAASFNAIDKALRTASKQADRVILKIDSTISGEVIEKAIYNRVRQTDIREVTVILDEEVITLSRAEIMNQTFYGKIKK